MRGQLPAGRPAHREAADDATGLVNGVASFDVGEGLETIHLASEFVRAAVTAIQVCRTMASAGTKSPESFSRPSTKASSVNFSASAMAPDVEPMLAGPAGFERRRHHQAVRMGLSHRSSRRSQRTTNPVCVVQGALPSRSERARSLPCLSSVRATATCLRVVELIVGQGVANRVVVDLDVRKEIDQASLALEGGANTVVVGRLSIFLPRALTFCCNSSR